MVQLDGNALFVVAVGLVLGIGVALDSLVGGGRSREDTWAAASRRSRRRSQRLEMHAGGLMMSTIFGAYGRAEIGGHLGAVPSPRIYRAPEVAEIPPQLVERSARALGHRAAQVPGGPYDNTSGGLPPMAWPSPGSASTAPG